MQPTRPKADRARRTVPPIEQRDWLKADELPATVGMSVSTINRHVRGEREPKIPFYGEKRYRRFRKVDIEAWRLDYVRRSMTQ